MTNAPFKGIKFVTDVSLDEIYSLINTKDLFAGKWHFKRTRESEEVYQKILKEKAWVAFKELKEKCKAENILQPKISYGYFDPVFLRRDAEGCHNPYWIPEILRKAQDDKIVPLQLVTVGQKVIDTCGQLFESHRYTEYLYLSGLAAATCEALAEYSHRNILDEIGIHFNKKKRLPTGSRISPGYPIWPDLSGQKRLAKLLQSEKIGVTLTENYQLVPEYSTSAMIII